MKSRWIRFDCKHNENVSRSVGQILGLVKLFDLPWSLWAVSKHLCRRVLHSEGGEKIKGCCGDPGKPQDEVFGDLSSATRGHGLYHRLSFLGVGAWHVVWMKGGTTVTLRTPLLYSCNQPEALSMRTITQSWVPVPCGPSLPSTPPLIYIKSYGWLQTQFHISSPNISLQ